MTEKKRRLELTWIGKEERPRLEPRILLEDQVLSYHASKRVSENDIFDNLLIHGDNLLALKALEQDFAGKVKCIYIDPPFNTGQAFEHYDDGIEHSIWLTLMRDRLEALHTLLSEDGSLFVHIDDNEVGYLICLCDEIFGRANRLSVATFLQSAVSGPKARNPGLVSTTNFILYYCKNRSHWAPNRVYVPIPRDARYGTYIENYSEDFSKWRFVPLRQAFAAAHGVEAKALRKQFGDQLEQSFEDFVLRDPRRVVQLARVQPKDVNEQAREALKASVKDPTRVYRSEREDLDDYYFMNGKQVLFYSSKTQEIDGRFLTGQVLSTLWSDLLSNNIHQEGGVQFPKGKKPEALLKRVIELSSSPGDIVLDSFAGSGTTGAVAHKMGRKWIMVELGEHCFSHVIPRVRRVIDGEDESGVTKALAWGGGGGFRLLKLAPSLLEKDNWGNWVVSKDYHPEMLAEAMCKLEGFRYEPDPDVFWIHGKSTETDFIYITTQNLSREQLRFISDHVGAERTLLICCAAFRAKRDEFPNLTLKKIPQAVLSRCEWGRDDYSLNVDSLPPVQVVEEQRAEPDPAPDDEKKNGKTNGSKKKSTTTRRRRKKASAMQELPLFAGIEDGGKSK